MLQGLTHQAPVWVLPTESSVLQMSVTGQGSIMNTHTPQLLQQAGKLLNTLRLCLQNSFS
jgi:hypothetical protein